MRENVCPYLGLKTDPKTALEFPSIGNHCHKAMPVAPVNAKHQERYCLTAQYEQCPIFQRQTVERMPGRVVAGRGFMARNRLLMVVILLTLIFAGVTVGAILLRQNPGLMVAPTTQAAGLDTETEIPTLPPTATLTQTPTPRNTETLIGGFRPFLPTVDLTRQACPRPAGWVTYIVKPADTLFRIAQIYSLTTVELMQANCIAEDTLVKTGEKIYVPGATPTMTPTITLTPTKTRTRPPYVPPTATSGGGGSKPPTNTPVPPTPVPPTPVPPTPVPPTPTATEPPPQ